MSPIAPFIFVIMVLGLLYGTYRIAKSDGWLDQFIASVRDRMGR